MPKPYGAPIPPLFYMLNICFIYVEYSFYSICSVIQMFVPYFKYSIFQIFIPNFKYLFYIPKICHISNVCSVLKWLHSYPSLFCISISVLCFKYLFCISNIPSNCKIFILIKRNFNSCLSKTLKKQQKSHRINNLYATKKKFSRQVPIVLHCWKIIYNL